MTQEVRSELEAIRDIPYRFGVSEGDMGITCYEKSLRAKACLESHGYTARFRCGAFRWSGVAFPADILSRITNDSAEHVWVEYEEDGVWRVLDLTFDRALAGAVPVQWVNISNESPYVVPTQEVYSVERSADIMRQLEDTQTLKRAHKDDLARNKDFYTLVNVYFEGVRKTV